MKILLIDPPYAIFTGYDNRYFPVGLSCIGSALKRGGHDVVVYDVDREKKDVGDLNFSEEYQRLKNYQKEINRGTNSVWEGIGRVVADYSPDVIGITALTMKFGSVLKTAEVCKKTRPAARVIVGGPHATDWPDICFQSPHIDVCVSGEGEQSVVLILEALENGRENLEGIPGASFKRGGEVVLRKVTPYVTELDECPWPGRELLLNQHKYTSEDMGVIMTSRGCPYNCGFCSHPPKVRYRNLDNVIGEIKHVKERYGTRLFAVKDDSFTVSRKRTMEFCALLIKEKLAVNWECSTRVNLIDDELLSVMQKAGCNTVKVGIETGSERIMKEVNKGITLEQAKKAADTLNRRGMFWSAYFMYGLPTETREDMLKTLEFMKELNPPYAGLGLYAPVPNTRLWNLGLELGLIEPDVGINHFFDTNPKDYFFRDFKKRVANLDHGEFLETAGFLMKEFNGHNTHWTNMLRRGWSRRKAYKKDPKLMLGDVRKAFRWALGSRRAAGSSS
ncbi:MAG: radical SAM protein [bacterium]